MYGITSSRVFARLYVYIKHSIIALALLASALLPLHVDAIS
jgi:hypothetical protein